MATTDIHAITQTVEASISYIMSDKKEATLKDDIADSIKYIMNDKTGEVTYPTLTSTLNCMNPSNPTEDFYALAKGHGASELRFGNAKTKDGAPILAWHLVQSFEGQVDPRIANEIGRKLAEELFGNYAVVISTHTNTDNTHNHIEFCAWDLDGKKYNLDHAAYQKIRDCSDRLCEEYGLSVLEETRKQKLLRWEDGEGNVHYYEPTKRKDDLLEKRKEGEISTDDVNSYRNTRSYDASEARKQTNVEIVKQAIDSVLPHATSYEHLLAMMREMGFKVKDKKKNGDWLAHITFIPPTAEKGVRDYTIDKETGYYTRENLTAVIEAQNAERYRQEQEAQTTRGMSQKEAEPSVFDIPYYEEYVYGKVDVQNINEDYRADVDEYGEVRVVRRGEPEREVIRDIKKTDLAFKARWDTHTLEAVVAQQEAEHKKRRQPKSQDAILYARICDGFENLRFMEKHNVYSYGQINETVKGIWQQYNACVVQIGEAEKMVARLEQAANAPDILTEVRKRIDQGRGNPAYMMEQYAGDVRLMKSCIEDISKYHVSGLSDLQSLQASIQKHREQINTLRLTLSSFAGELSAYNRCVETLSRIDRENRRDIRAELAEYRNIVKLGQQMAALAAAKNRGHSGKSLIRDDGIPTMESYEGEIAEVRAAEEREEENSQERQERERREGNHIL